MSRRGRLASKTDRALLGDSGIVAVLLVGIGGQLVWLARGLGSISLADALAIEGVIVAVIFGMLAIRIALRHEIQLRGVSGELGDVSNRLEGVSKSVQTKPIGDFPQFILQIAELLARAEKSISVMCDNPAYGIFSNGPDFDSYAAELKRKIALRSKQPFLSVDLMFLADREREELHQDQIRLYARNEEEWQAWRDLPETQIRLKGFLERVHGVCDPEAPALADADIVQALATLTVDGYTERLEAANNALLSHHFYGANRRVLRFRDEKGQPQVRSSGPSIYFWMRDDLEAVFAIVPLGDKLGESREVAFETRDPSMIKALRGTFSRYQLAAVPLSDHPRPDQPAVGKRSRRRDTPRSN